MNRRDVLSQLGGLSLAAVAMNTVAEEHQHHHHIGASKYQLLIDATGDCISKGEACLAHCLMLLADGESEMAGCAKSVNQTLAVCRALQSLAAQGSSLTIALAKVALDACIDCEKECRKHEDKHQECKACREACSECVKQCKAIIA